MQHAEGEFAVNSESVSISEAWVRVPSAKAPSASQMGCRQSKDAGKCGGLRSLPAWRMLMACSILDNQTCLLAEGTASGSTTLPWLTNLGLQQHYPAFAKAGYSNVSSLVGLEENPLRVIQQFCPDGLPAEHRQRLLAAAKQLAAQKSLSSNVLGKTRTSFNPASHDSQLEPVADLRQPVHHQMAAPLSQAHAVSGTMHSGMDNSLTSYASYTSCSSADSEVYSTEDNSRASTQLSAVTTASKQQPPGARASHAAAVANGPAPTLDQLQQLQSQMEADYARLPSRPAHVRASSRASHAAVAPSPLDAGREVPPSIGSTKQHALATAGTAPLVGTGAVPAPVPTPTAQQLQQMQINAPVPKRQQKTTSAQSGSSARFTAQSRRIAAGEQAGSAKSSDHSSRVAAAKQARANASVSLKQLKKAKKTWPNEPFVQVFTNFDTLSQV